MFIILIMHFPETKPTHIKKIVFCSSGSAHTAPSPVQSHSLNVPLNFFCTDNSYHPADTHPSLSLSLTYKKEKKKSRVCLSLSPLSLSFSLRIVFFWTFGKVSEWVLWVVGRAVGDWKERTVKEIPQSYEKRANERDRKNRVAALKWLLQFHVLEGNIVFCFFFFLHFFSAMLLPKLLCFIILSSAFLCLSYEPRNPEGNIINLQLLV